MAEAASHNLAVLPKAKTEAPPWKGMCSSRCFMAKTDRKKCKCRCRGEYHSKGQQLKSKEKAIDEFLIP